MVLGRFGWFCRWLWVVLAGFVGGCRWVWVVLGRFVGGCRWVRVVLGRFGWFWVVLPGSVFWNTLVGNGRKVYLGPLHMSPVTGLARLPVELCCLYVHMGHFSPVDRDEIQETKPKLLLSFATVVALWTFVTLLIKLIRMLLKSKYIHGKNYAILVAMMRKRRY